MLRTTGTKAAVAAAAVGLTLLGAGTAQANDTIHQHYKAASITYNKNNDVVTIKDNAKDGRGVGITFNAHSSTRGDSQSCETRGGKGSKHTCKFAFSSNAAALVTIYTFKPGHKNGVVDIFRTRA